MSIYSEMFKNEIDAFNVKYGVNFTLESFESKKNGFAYMNLDNPGNAAYNMIFAEMYQKAIRNYAKGSIERFRSTEMFQDFEKMIMEPYRQKCIEDKVDHNPTPFGGKTPVKALESMSAYLRKAPKSAVEFYAEQYRNRDLRLRDMKQFANQIERNSEEQLTTAANYIAALDKVRESRSFLWKVFHPIQNYAEKRDIKVLKEQLNYSEIASLADDFVGKMQIEENHVNEVLESERELEASTISAKDLNIKVNPLMDDSEVEELVDEPEKTRIDIEKDLEGTVEDSFSEFDEEENDLETSMTSSL